MNFLGHLYLSGDDPLTIVGNFMGDAVKGRDLSRFPPAVERGIRLHRAIDSFTDQHPAQRQGRLRLRAHAGRYAGVAMDLFYDHLLASRWNDLHAEPLGHFTRRMYALLREHGSLLPGRTRLLLMHMEAGDWLWSYAHIDGIAQALAGMARRTGAGPLLFGAERVLAEHRQAYEEEFAVFLGDVRQHVNDRA
jgi:acyl carrier protein phosphodiesterase